MVKARLFFVAGLILAGCGGCDSLAPATTTVGPAPPAPSPSATTTDISVLMMGNSHTSVNGLPETLAAMPRAARPTRTVAVVPFDAEANACE